jgi:hypothetical protein
MSLGRPLPTLELSVEERRELSGFAASRSLPRPFCEETNEQNLFFALCGEVLGLHHHQRAPEKR